MAGNSLSQFTLPTNFFVRTSDELLLQPEPQYIFARLMFAAMMVELGIPDAMGLPGRQTPVTGAEYVTPQSQRLELNEGREVAAAAFAVAIDFKAAPGSTLRVNRPLYPNTTYTAASRKVPSGTTISTQPIAPGSEQIEMTIFRYAGPYDQANSRVAPFGIEAFDANMGVHKAVKIVGGNLKRDYDKFVDTQLVTLLEGASSNVYPTGFTTDNGITAVGAAKCDYNTIARAERALDEANIPYFGTGKRCIVLTPQQLQELKDDAQYARYAEFHKEYNPLFPEYVADVGTFHVLKSNTLNKVNNSSSVPVNRGEAFGPGVFAGGMGRPPHVAASTDDNYGETQKVVWIGDLGFELADSRFVVGVRTG
jgi:hypothetical protein